VKPLCIFSSCPSKAAKSPAQQWGIRTFDNKLSAQKVQIIYFKVLKKPIHIPCQVPE
jgi:hypothetical protein